MDDIWLMIRIFLIVVAWGGALLFAGYALEMLARVFARDKPVGATTGPDAAPKSG